MTESTQRSTLDHTSPSPAVMHEADFPNTSVDLFVINPEGILRKQERHNCNLFFHSFYFFSIVAIFF